MSYIHLHHKDAVISRHPTATGEGLQSPPGQGPPGQVVSAYPAHAARLRAEWAIAGAVSFVALVLRVVTLNVQSAWVDEGYSMAMARHSVSFITNFTGQYDTHPPLYYLILHGWLGIFGAGVVQGRLLSALCGTCGVLILYGLVRMLYDRSTAACAALLLAMSPVALWLFG